MLLLFIVTGMYRIQYGSQGITRGQFLGLQRQPKLYTLYLFCNLFTKSFVAKILGGLSQGFPPPCETLPGCVSRDVCYAFFPSNYAFKQFSRIVLIMLKKVPIMLLLFLNKIAFSQLPNTYMYIVHSYTLVSLVCPMASAFPTRRVNCDLTLSYEVRRLRQP